MSDLAVIRRAAEEAIDQRLRAAILHGDWWEADVEDVERVNLLHDALRAAVYAPDIAWALAVVAGVQIAVPLLVSLGIASTCDAPPPSAPCAQEPSATPPAEGGVGHG